MKASLSILLPIALTLSSSQFDGKAISAPMADGSATTQTRTVAQTQVPTEIDVATRAYLLEQIAITYAEIGQTQKALDVAQETAEIGNLSSVLHSIASTLIGAGEIEQALEVSQTIADDETQFWVMNSIVYALAETGEIDRALQRIQTIADDERKAWILPSIIFALVQAENILMFPPIVASAYNQTEGTLGIFAAALIDEGYDINSSSFFYTGDLLLRHTNKYQLNLYIGFGAPEISGTGSFNLWSFEITGRDEPFLSADGKPINVDQIEKVRVAMVNTDPKTTRGTETTVQQGGN